MLLILLLLLGTSILAPMVQHRLGARAGYLLALPPAIAAGYFWLCGFGPPRFEHISWASSLGLDLSLRMDGWSALFALLISGIGALVVLYASCYLERDPAAGRFMSALLVFMASMLGLVLSDNIILLFIFWELTSITSYLLIGHEHDRDSARKAALQAMLVTGGGGLLLLAGLILMGIATGHWTLSALLADPSSALRSPTAGASILLVLGGCFTKSAQVPFHFWLPNAMEAPTPASAYLHSSTMVKAGVYLLGRLLPVLGDHPWWDPALQVIGWGTFLFGAWMVLRNSKIKRVLAFTTLSALGLMVLLIGQNSPMGIHAVVLLLPAHALYKGALFLLAGALDHETGEKDLARMGGLRHALPTLFAGGALAALSMLGLAPFLGFLAKETLLEALLVHSWPLLFAALSALALLGSAGLAVGASPFLGPPIQTLRTPHAPSPSLWIPPAILGLAGLASGLFPTWIGHMSGHAAKAVLPDLTPWSPALWHGLTPAFLLGLAALTLSLLLWRYRPLLLAAAERLPSPKRWGPEALYERGLKSLVTVARLQTKVLQTGYLRHYLLLILTIATTLVALPLLWIRPDLDLSAWRDLRIYELGLSVIIMAAVFWCIQARTRLGVVVALGFVGYSVALLFLIFGAPDLAMTQFVVETLTVLLFVLTLRKLPPFFRISKTGGRLRDGLVACSAGLAMAMLTLLAAEAPKNPALKDFFLENSYLLAHGRNVVNVILVDFRGIDTLGEISVLAVVGLGTSALLRLVITR